MTINTPVRADYQLSESSSKRVNHVNVYDSKDPIQSKGGNSFTILPENKSTAMFTGEFGGAGRTFSNARNIGVKSPTLV